jgi:hypothetical protein
MTDFADRLLARVRVLLKRHPAFAGMTRDALDLYLADLERDIRRDLGDWNDQIERAYEQGRADAETDREYEAEMEKAAKKAKCTESQRTQNQEEHHADR